MKKTLILALAVAATLTCSCDFIRMVAGRPTSAQLEQMHQEQLQEQQARHQARLDSMKRVQQQMADSLAALERYLLDSLTQSKGTLLSPVKESAADNPQLEAMYYIGVGAFRTEAYAQRKVQQCEAAGYPATQVKYRSGVTVVAICPSNSLDQTLKNLRQIRGTEFCPKEGWILVNK